MAVGKRELGGLVEDGENGRLGRFRVFRRRRGGRGGCRFLRRRLRRPRRGSTVGADQLQNVFHRTETWTPYGERSVRDSGRRGAEDALPVGQGKWREVETVQSVLRWDVGIARLGNKAYQPLAVGGRQRGVGSVKQGMQDSARLHDPSVKARSNWHARIRRHLSAGRRERRCDAPGPARLPYAF